MPQICMKSRKSHGHIFHIKSPLAVDNHEENLYKMVFWWNVKFRKLPTTEYLHHVGRGEVSGMFNIGPFWQQWTNIDREGRGQ